MLSENAQLTTTPTFGTTNTKHAGQKRKQSNYLATSINMTAYGKSYTQVALTTKLNATRKTSQYNGHPTTFAPISY